MPRPEGLGRLDFACKNRINDEQKVFGFGPNQDQLEADNGSFSKGQKNLTFPGPNI